MTESASEPTEIVSEPEPTVTLPPAAAFPPGEPDGWVAGPPPPPPGRDPDIPVVEAAPGAAGPRPPRARPPRARPGGADRWERALTRLRREPAWTLAAAAILVAYVSAWLDAVLGALRHQPGLTAQQRLLDLFGPGSVEWGVLMLVALGFIAAARRLPDGPDGELGRRLPMAVLIASGTVAAAAALGLVVELANFGHGIDAAFSGIVARLGALAAAGAALWWAWQGREGAAP